MVAVVEDLLVAEVAATNAPRAPLAAARPGRRSLPPGRAAAAARRQAGRRSAATAASASARLNQADAGDAPLSAPPRSLALITL